MIKGLKMKLVLSIVLLSLLACSPTYLVKKMKKNDFKGLSVAVAPILNATINFPGNIEKDFGKGNKDSLIINYLQKKISKGLIEKSCFKNVELCRYQGHPKFTVDSIKDSNDYSKIIKPAGDNAFVGCNNEVALIIYNVYVDTITNEKKYENMDLSITSLYAKPHDHRAADHRFRRRLCTVLRLLVGLPG